MTRLLCRACDGEILRECRLHDSGLGADVDMSCRCSSVTVTLSARPIDADRFPAGWTTGNGVDT